jgi:hypothetical protein
MLSSTSNLDTLQEILHVNDTTLTEIFDDFVNRIHMTLGASGTRNESFDCQTCHSCIPPACSVELSCRWIARLVPTRVS